MRLSPRIVTPAAEAAWPVSFDEVKKFCDIDHSDDDPDVRAMVQTAIDWLQPPMGCLRVSIARQTLRVDLPCWPAKSITLPAGPVASIGSVTYFDQDNAEQTLSPGAYFADDDVLIFTDAFTAPSLYERPSAVRITYDAGYGEGVQACPNQIKLAIKQAVRHWYDNRVVVQSVGALSMMALGVDDLIAGFRVR